MSENNISPILGSFIFKLSERERDWFLSIKFNGDDVSSVCLTRAGYAGSYAAQLPGIGRRDVDSATDEKFLRVLNPSATSGCYYLGSNTEFPESWIQQ